MICQLLVLYNLLSLILCFLDIISGQIIPPRITLWELISRNLLLWTQPQNKNWGIYCYEWTVFEKRREFKVYKSKDNHVFFFLYYSCNIFMECSWNVLYSWSTFMGIVLCSSSRFYTVCGVLFLPLNITLPTRIRKKTG